MSGGSGGDDDDDATVSKFMITPKKGKIERTNCKNSFMKLRGWCSANSYQQMKVAAADVVSEHFKFGCSELSRKLGTIFFLFNCTKTQNFHK